MSQILPNFPEPPLGEISRSQGVLSREIAIWIESLPLANVGETYNLVVGALTKVNDAGLPPQENFKVLELFRRPVQYLSDALKRHLLGMSFPLPFKASKVVAQLCDLHLAMANGYQGICNELLGLNSHRQDFSLLGASLHRALKYRGQELLTAYQAYEAGLPGRWRNIHRLYETAERKGIQLSAVKDPYLPDKQDTTIEDQYKQILLLALANPLRFSQPDIDVIYRLSEKWAPQCRIYSYDPFHEAPHNGVVDLEGDEPPIHLAYSRTPQHTAYRILDASTLMHSLEKLISQNPAESPTQTLHSSAMPMPGGHLLQSVIAAWGPTPGRCFSRSQPGLDEAEVGFGFDVSHRNINRRISMANNRGNGGSGLPVERKNASPINPALDDEASYLCSVINESAGGSCLKWSGAGEGKIRLGELLAFRHIHEPDDEWSLAVIRWLTNANSHTVKFGIQLLSPDAIPVLIRLENDQGAETECDYVKGFYLPELKATRQPDSLIVPFLLYHTNDVVTLIKDHQEHHLRLVKAIDSTPIFSRFQFAAMSADKNQAASTATSPTKQVDSSLSVPTRRKHRN